MEAEGPPLAVSKVEDHFGMKSVRRLEGKLVADLVDWWRHRSTGCRSGGPSDQ